MSKRSVFTTITPLPAGISRETVMDTLRTHMDMIDLNPLVIHRSKCKAPGFAPADEYHAVWYQLKDKIQYLPGGLIQGNVAYHGCFHDLPNGLQTHIYAPMGLDIKGKWLLGGSLPGEPAQPVELGLNIPKQGLYLREDVDMRCNIVMAGFVKKTLKKAHGTLVKRLLEKAEIQERDMSNQWINTFHNKRNSTLAVSPLSSRPASVSCSNLSSTLSTPSVHDNALHRLSMTGSMLSLGARSVSDDGRSSSYGSPDLRLDSVAYKAYSPFVGGGQLQLTKSQESQQYHAYQPSSRPPSCHSLPPTFAAELPAELPADISTRGPHQAEIPKRGSVPVEMPGEVPAALKVASRPGSIGSQQPSEPVELPT